MSLDIFLFDPSATYGVGELHWQNITHNLTRMASEAGIYKSLWRPEEIEIVYAGDLIEPLRNGISDMENRPEHYMQFSAENGWGTYEQFLPWLEELLIACEAYPMAVIDVCR